MGPGFEPLRAYYGKVTPTRSPLLWRDGRVVDCIGLENRRTERYRGFESLSLRRHKGWLKNFNQPFLYSELEACLQNSEYQKGISTCASAFVSRRSPRERQGWAQPIPLSPQIKARDILLGISFFVEYKSNLLEVV